MYVSDYLFMLLLIYIAINFVNYPPYVIIFIIFAIICNLLD